MAVKFSGVDSLKSLFNYLCARSGTDVENLLSKDKFLQRFKTLIESDYRNLLAASLTAMQAIAASSTAMQAIAASLTAMQAIAASSTAVYAVVSSNTARSIVQQSSHLSSVAETMYTTCNNDTNRFQKFDTYIWVNQSTPTKFWTPTTGQTTSQPNPEACVCFCWKVIDNTSRTDQKIGIYSLEYVNTERLEVSLPGGTAGEVVNISPYEVLFGGVKCVDKIANAGLNKDLYFYGFKAL